MINNDRNMNDDFAIGEADGSIKSLAPSRGGIVDPTNITRREQQLQNQYGREYVWPIQAR